ERAIIQDPQYKPALTKLLEYSDEVAKGFPSQQRWGAVLKRADALLAVDDQNAYALYCRGRALLALKEQREENQAEGLAALTRAVEIAPENVDYGLALAFWESTNAREDGVTQDSAQEYARYNALVDANTQPGPDALKIRTAYATRLANRGQTCELGAHRQQLAKADAEKKGLQERVQIHERNIQQLETIKEECYAKASALLQQALELAGDNKEDQAEARVRLAEYRFYRNVLRIAQDPEKQAEADQLTEPIRALLVEAIELDPDGFEPYELLANLYQSRQRYDDAIEVCDQRAKRGIGRKGLHTSERKQGMYSILLKAADMCLLKAGQFEDEAQRNPYLDRAQQHIEDAKGEWPGAPSALHAQGKILLARGRDLDALAKFEEADRIFPTSQWENKWFLANLYLAQGQYGAARSAIEAACQGPTATTQVWATAAEIYLKTRDYRSAVTAATQALRREPDNQRAKRSLAEAYRKLNAPELAEDALAALPADDPRNALFKARALATEKKFSEALELLQQILQDDPTNLDAVRTAVWLHGRLDQPDQAKALVQRALELKPDDASLAALQLALDTDLTPEERSTKRLALIEGMDDAYQRALELTRYYVDRRQYEQAEARLQEAERLLAERATPEAVRAVERWGEAATREIINQRFALTFERALAAGDDADWSPVEKIAADAAKNNIDGARGLTFYGRLQLFRDNPKMAVDSFSEALEMRPNDSETLTLLAQAYLDLRQLEPAREAFEQALVINPNNGLAHKGLAMLASNRRDAAAFARHIAACQQFLPNDPWVQNQKLLLDEVADPKVGIERRLGIRNSDPKDVDNLIRLGALYVKLDPPEADKARECYDAALQAAEDRFTVAWTVSQFYNAFVDPTQALDLLKAEVQRETDPELKAASQTLVGRFLRNAGELEQANAAYLEAADIAETLQTCFRLGEHFLATEQFEPALDWFTKAMNKADAEGSTGAPEIRKRRIECLVRLNRLDEAMDVVNELETQLPDAPSVALQRANIEIARGEFAKAITTLTLILEQRPDDTQPLFQRAMCYARLAKWNLAIVDLERLKARQPTAFDLMPRKLLARAYDMTNRLDLASSELEALAEAFPDDVSVTEALIGLYRDHKRYKDAKLVATRMVNQTPGEPRWYAVRAELAAQALRNNPLPTGGDVARAKEVATIAEDLSRAAQLGDFHPVYVSRLLATYSEFGPPDDGIRYFEKTLPPEKRAPSPILYYATLLAKKGLPGEAARQYRNAVLLEAENRVSIATAVAQQAIEALGQDQAIELFRTPPADEPLRRPGQFILAMLLQSAKQYSEEITILDELLQNAEPENEQAQLAVALGIAAGLAERNPEARQYYEQALKLQPDNWVALNNLAYLLSDVLNEHQVALPYARRAAALNSRPTVLDTLGTVLTKLGSYREAIAELSRAVRDDPRFVAAYYHLAEAYRCLGEFSDAEHLLDEANRLIADARNLDDADTGEEYAQPIEEALDKIRNRDQSP
ncbi:MAG TPA: tetratricopeptide repeat protein, partial [Phycisphaerae bacterium]|nr:tetratricopeptide repeat protein [Phycisphaerae bacterium]